MIDALYLHLECSAEYWRSQALETRRLLLESRRRERESREFAADLLQTIEVLQARLARYERGGPEPCPAEPDAAEACAAPVVVPVAVQFVEMVRNASFSCD